MTSLLLAKAGGAGGAPLGDLVAGTLVGGALVLIAVAIGGLHRAHKIKWLGALGAYSERVSGLPRWAALPGAVGGASLLLALFGFWWDVATHIDKGRDQGPFGTGAHYPILFGLGGIALGGFLAVVLGCDEDEPSAIRLRKGWSAPLGGVLLLACGAFALSGFPLDDTWHRLFGQDVTLWGPTHILMIGSASLATLAVWALLVEGRRSARRRGLTPADPQRSVSLIERVRGPMIAGGFLVGLSSLQGEFDFGVPQYSLILHPVMLMVAAGCGLVTARIVLGPFGALRALAFYLFLRVVLTLIVGDVFGQSTMHFPLYIAEGALVELAAWRMGTDRPLRLGIVAGGLIGTLGLAAEWGWSHVWMPLPWPSSILAETAVLGLLAAVAAGIMGAYIGGTLRDPDCPAKLGPAWLAGLAGAVMLFCVAYPLPKTGGIDARAVVTLQEAATAPRRAADATVRIVPASAVKDAAWLTATAWQGDGLAVDRMTKVGDGVYRTTRPLPLYGNWKSLIRLSDGRSLAAIPVYLPADPEIPARAVAAPPAFERTFVSDGSILQRESRGGSLALVIPAYLLLALIIGGEFAALAWGLRRLRLISVPGERAERRPAHSPSGRPAVTA